MADSSIQDMSLESGSASALHQYLSDPFMGAHRPDETIMRWQPNTEGIKAQANSAHPAGMTVRPLYPINMEGNETLDKNADQIMAGHQGSVLDHTVLSGSASLAEQTSRPHHAKSNDGTELDTVSTDNDVLSPDSVEIHTKDFVASNSNADHEGCLANPGSKRPADDDGQIDQVAKRRRSLNSEAPSGAHGIKQGSIESQGKDVQAETCTLLVETRGVESFDAISECSQVTASGQDTASRPAVTVESSNIDTSPQTVSVIGESRPGKITTATSSIYQRNASPASPSTPKHRNIDFSASQHPKKPPKPDLNQDMRLSAAERQQRFDAFMATSCIPSEYFASAGMEPHHEAHAVWRALYEQAWRQMWKERRCPILHIRTMVRMAHNMPIEGPITPKATPPQTNSVCSGLRTDNKSVTVATTKTTNDRGLASPTPLSRQRRVAAVGWTGPHGSKSNAPDDGMVRSLEFHDTSTNGREARTTSECINSQRLQSQANGGTAAEASNHMICPPSPSLQSLLNSYSRHMIYQSTLTLQSPQQMDSSKTTMPLSRGGIDPVGVMQGGLARKEEAQGTSLQGLTMDTRTGLLYVVNSSGHRIPIGTASPIQNSGSSLAMPPSYQQE